VDIIWTKNKIQKSFYSFHFSSFLKEPMSYPLLKTFLIVLGLGVR